MKKYLFLTLICIIFLISIFFTGLNSNIKINWPDFIRVNDKFYLNQSTEVKSSDIDVKIGIINSNSPEKTSKWTPINNEASKLLIGTEVYSIKDKSLLGLCVYVDNKYIYYQEVSEDEFYDQISNKN